MDRSILNVRVASAVLLGMLWFLFVPFIFVLFYSVIEVQSAAKAAAGADGKTAPFLVRARADRINQIETDVALLSPMLERLKSDNGKNNSKWYTDFGTLVSAVTILGARLSIPDIDNAKCGGVDFTQPPVLACYQAVEGKVMSALEDLDPSSPVFVQKRDAIFGWRKAMEDALVSVQTDNSLIDQSKADLSWRQTQLLAEIAEYKSLLGLQAGASVSIPSPVVPPGKDAALSAITAAYTATASNQSGTPAAPQAAQQPAPETSAQPADAGVSPVNDHALGAVALSYNQIRLHPFFGAMFAFFFFLPAGVIVALFTALMGAIGAVVVALLARLAERRSAAAALVATADPAAAPVPAVVAVKADDTTAGFWISFLLLPLLGAMSGFMVFFVISAGAAFLIQPGTVNATEAVNSLSPSALASLGVFAGLSAERALKWLNAKAESFFETPDDKGPVVQGVH